MSNNIKHSEDFIERVVIANNICDSLNQLGELLDDLNVSRIMYDDLLLMDYILWHAVSLAKEIKEINRYEDNKN